MAKRRQRFVAASRKDSECIYQLTNTSGKVLRTLIEDNEGMSYKQLNKKTKVPMSSLYVFVSRMRRAGLVEVIHDPEWLKYVLIQPALGVHIHPSVYVG